MLINVTSCPLRIIANLYVIVVFVCVLFFVVLTCQSPWGHMGHMRVQLDSLFFVRI
jgi:hypothetical protein